MKKDKAKAIVDLYTTKDQNGNKQFGIKIDISLFSFFNSRNKKKKGKTNGK